MALKKMIPVKHEENMLVGFESLFYVAFTAFGLQVAGDLNVSEAQVKDERSHDTKGNKFPGAFKTPQAHSPRND